MAGQYRELSLDEQHELVRAWLAGDAEAFERIFEFLLPYLDRYCMRRVANRPDADDLIQETLFRVVRYLRTYTFEGSLLGWVHRIAENVVNDYFRHQYLGEERVEIERFPGGYDPPADDLVLPPDRGEEEDEALSPEQAKLQRCVGEILARLRPDQARLLRARFRGGAPIEMRVVARELLGRDDDAAVQALRMRQTRAVAAFRREVLRRCGSHESFLAAATDLSTPDCCAREG